MPDLWVVVLLVVSVAVGLLTGRGLYALWLAHLRHNEKRPDCPERGEVLRDAKRVQLDIDQLTRGPHHAQ